MCVCIGLFIWIVCKCALCWVHLPRWRKPSILPQSAVDWPQRWHQQREKTAGNFTWPLLILHLAYVFSFNCYLNYIVIYLALQRRQRLSKTNDWDNKLGCEILVQSACKKSTNTPDCHTDRQLFQRFVSGQSSERQKQQITKLFSFGKLH